VRAEATLNDVQRAEVLAAAAGAMVWSRDSAAAARAVAEAAVPRLADWCAIDVLDGETACRRLAVAHADPRCQAYIQRLLGTWEPDPLRRGVAHVVLTGEREVALDAADAGALVLSPHAELEQVVGELGVAGYVSVPIRADARALGALTLVVADRRRRFAEADVSLAETLARMAALPIAHARLDDQIAVLNRRQDDVLAALSHELRTPLTAMMAWLQLLRHGASATETARGLNIIERNGRLLSHLIDDLVDTSHLVMGRLSVERRPVELAQVVQEVVRELGPNARDKGVRLEVELQRTARCLGDRARLAQVVMALVSNAVKFTPAGGHVTVTLGTDATHVQLRVVDSGRGISPDLLPHVFDVFRREDRAPGLGLGLVMVRGLVALHGGNVEAASAGVGHGATFTVRLPRH
jgi:signal transduction histidine kinase